jgi:hypothetical protein
MPAALLDLLEADPSAHAVHRLTFELSEDPALAPHVASLYSMWIDLMASVVRTAQQQGTLRADVDPKVAAEGAVAAFVGFERMSAAACGGADLRQRVERFAHLYLTALRAPAAEPGPS